MLLFLLVFVKNHFLAEARRHQLDDHKMLKAQFLFCEEIVLKILNFVGSFKIFQTFVSIHQSLKSPSLALLLFVKLMKRSPGYFIPVERRHCVKSGGSVVRVDRKRCVDCFSAEQTNTRAVCVQTLEACAENDWVGLLLLVRVFLVWKNDFWILLCSWARRVHNNNFFEVPCFLFSVLISP